MDGSERRRPRRPRPWSGGSPSGAAGVTLVEVLVSLAILAVLMGAVATTLVQSMELTGEARWRVVAANVATSETERLRLANPRDVPVGTDVVTRDTSLGEVRVERTAEWIPADSTADACQSPTSAPRDLLRVTVEVAWPDGRFPSSSTQTVLTPDVGTRDVERGHLAVRLMDRDARAPQPRPLVRVTGGPDHVLRSHMVSRDGCVLVDHLKPGDYHVEVLADGVDEQGGPPEATASVQVASTSSVQVTFDDPATIEATFTAQSGSALPAGVDVALRNTGLVPDERMDVPGTGSTRTIGPVFPFATGYEVFASVGQCAGIDPAAVGRTRTQVATDPGASAAASVPLATVRVRTVNRGGQPVPGVVVRANAPADEGCPEGAELELGRTGTDDELLVAVPMGTWTFRGPGNGGTPAGPYVIADPSVIHEVEVGVGG